MTMFRTYEYTPQDQQRQDLLSYAAGDFAAGQRVDEGIKAHMEKTGQRDYRKASFTIRPSNGRHTSAGR